MKKTLAPLVTVLLALSGALTGGTLANAQPDPVPPCSGKLLIRYADIKQVRLTVSSCGSWGQKARPRVWWQNSSGGGTEYTAAGAWIGTGGSSAVYYQNYFSRSKAEDLK